MTTIDRVADAETRIAVRGASRANAVCDDTVCLSLAAIRRSADVYKNGPAESRWHAGRVIGCHRVIPGIPVHWLRLCARHCPHPDPSARGNRAPFVSCDRGDDAATRHC